MLRDNLFFPSFVRYSATINMESNIIYICIYRWYILLDDFHTLVGIRKGFDTMTNAHDELALLSHILYKLMSINTSVRSIGNDGSSLVQSTTTKAIA